MSQSNIFPFKRLTRLKDYLLKQIVFNFPKIFLYKDPKNETYKLKRKVRLPQKLFESIQIMSYEIGWPIQINYLKPCLLNREKLNLPSVNLSTTHLTEEDFIEICKSEGPITHLKICGIRFTDAMVDALEIHSHRLEFLEISAHKGYPEKFNAINFCKSPLRFPKLRKLHVQCIAMEIRHFFRIDLSSCSETLESLELNDFDIFAQEFQSKELALKFIECWKSLKVLTNLRVVGFYLYPKMEDVVSQLKNVSSLRVTMCDVRNPGFYLSRLMQGLPQLRHFGILYDFERNDMEWFRNKKLNYLGFQSHQSPNDYKHAFTTAQKCGLNNNLDSHITYHEYSGIYTFGYYGELTIFKFNREHCKLWKRVEELLNRSMCLRWQEFSIRGGNLLNFLIHAESCFTFSSDFLMRLANFVVNFSSIEKNTLKFDCLLANYMKLRQLVKFMLNYVVQNPRAVISSLYFNYLMKAWKSRTLADNIIEVKKLKKL